MGFLNHHHQVVRKHPIETSTPLERRTRSWLCQRSASRSGRNRWTVGFFMVEILDSPEVWHPLEQKVSWNFSERVFFGQTSCLKSIWQNNWFGKNMSWWCNLDFANIRQNAGRLTCWLVDSSVNKGAAPMLKIMPPSSPATASLKPRHPLMFDFFFSESKVILQEQKSKRKVRAQCFSFCPTSNCLYCKLEIQRFSWSNTLLGSPKVREEDDLACP